MAEPLFKNLKDLQKKGNAILVKWGVIDKQGKVIQNASPFLISPRVFRIWLGVSIQRFQKWRTSNPEYVKQIQDWVDILLGNVEQDLLNTTKDTTKKNINGAIFILRTYDQQTYVPELNEYHNLPPVVIEFDIKKRLIEANKKRAKEKNGTTEVEAIKVNSK